MASEPQGAKQAAFDAIDEARKIADEDDWRFAVHLAEAVVYALVHVAEAVERGRPHDERYDPPTVRDHYRTVIVEHTDSQAPVGISTDEITAADLVVLISPRGLWTVVKDRYGREHGPAGVEQVSPRVLAAVYDRKLEEPEAHHA